MHQSLAKDTREIRQGPSKDDCQCIEICPESGWCKYSFTHTHKKKGAFVLTHLE